MDVKSCEKIGCMSDPRHVHDQVLKRQQPHLPAAVCLYYWLSSIVTFKINHLSFCCFYINLDIQCEIITIQNHNYRKMCDSYFKSIDVTSFSFI